MCIYIDIYESDRRPLFAPSGCVEYAPPDPEVPSEYPNSETWNQDAGSCISRTVNLT